MPGSDRSPNQYSGPTDYVEAPAYATAVGLLQYGKLHQGQTVVDVREKASVTGWFKRVTNWLKGEF